MTKRAIPILFTATLVLVPLAGCNQPDSAITTRRDAQGNPEIHVDGKKVDQKVEQAQKDLKTAGHELAQGANQVGGEIQRGAEKVNAKVGPIAREALNDAGITARVQAKLVADPEVKSLHVGVATVDGRVTLSGKVSSEAERATAERLAVNTDGVKSVVNVIQVAGEKPPPPTEVPGAHPPGS